MAKLPGFLLALASDVEWEEEKEALRGAALTISELFSCQMTTYRDSRDQALCVDEAGARRCDEEEKYIQHTLLPSMRVLLKPSTRRASDATVVQVASLERLYKIFERC